jgi:hypothetical protein
MYKSCGKIGRTNKKNCSERILVTSWSFWSKTYKFPCSKLWIDWLNRKIKNCRQMSRSKRIRRTKN